MITLTPLLAAIENEEDRTLIAVLYETYAVDMKRYARSIVGEHFAEDVLHNAFQKLILNVDDLKEMSHDKRRLYAFTAIRWCALDVKRKEEKYTVIEDEYIEVISETTPSVIDKLLDREGYEYLKTCIRTWRDPLREACEMKYLMHMKEREIAQLLGLTEKNVNARIFRGKHVLQKMIRENDCHD